MSGQFNKYKLETNNHEWICPLSNQASAEDISDIITG